MDFAHIKRLIIGGNSVVFGVGLVAGVVLGLDMWWVYPYLGHIYHLVPDHPIDWQLLAVFIGIPAFIAARDGGLLPCWWVNLPPLFAIYLLEFTVVGAAGGNGVLREYSLATVVPAILTSVVVAFLWGTLGYGFGKAVQRGLRRFPHHQRTISWGRGG